MRGLFLFLLLNILSRSCAQNNQDYWEAYLAQYDKGVGSILVNMSLKENAPFPEFPFLLSARVKINHCSAEGLPEQNGWENLYKISDKIKAEIDSHIPSKAPGVFTYQCWRTDYYYIRDTAGVRQQLTAVFKNFFPGQEYKIEFRSDSSWEAYLTFLYPNEETIEYISNEKVLSQLMESGDKLIKARKIDHWLYFKTETGRSKFIIYATEQGFKVESQETGQNKERNFSLRLSRTDKVDIKSISAITLQLKRKARQYDGDYDGWETFVIKE